MYNHKTKHPSSGPGTLSQPRRPGSNERQAPQRQSGKQIHAYEAVIPGEIFCDDDPVELNAGAPVTTVRVVNTADRPVQIGSHYHFAEVNAALDLDRTAAWGKRLNVLAGGSMRFEPGAVEEVELVPIGGQRIVRGLRGLCGGQLDDTNPPF
ncbi:urease subunit beta [Georgenia subflava]|uniref:Urease subunit beta n=1 Tax=Georgenia subflava TaxID=1622177 RepID=A0A6N7EIZ6_9MICO|nr:urease subunit beta [Georgenia subflava]